MEARRAENVVRFSGLSRSEAGIYPAQDCRYQLQFGRTEVLTQYVEALRAEVRVRFSGLSVLRQGFIPHRVRLVNRQCLRQIPREIRIVASHHAHVIRKQLQRQDGEQGIDLRV